MNEITIREKENTGTSPTNNETFDKDGYLFVPDLIDPSILVDTPPEQRGQYKYLTKNENEFTFNPLEQQVNGSSSRYSHPKYKETHFQLGKTLEEIIGKKLYTTYYFDRFYYPGQRLEKHLDRDACEISVTVHISTTLEKAQADWPIFIKTPDVYEDKQKTSIKTPGEERSLILKPGDGVIYKGCERPHWRNEMPGNRKFKFFSKPKEEPYYHQIFFHYVLQNGNRAHCAFDAAQ